MSRPQKKGQPSTSPGLQLSAVHGPPPAPHLLHNLRKPLFLYPSLGVLPGIEIVRVDDGVRPADAAIGTYRLVADLKAFPLQRVARVMCSAPPSAWKAADEETVKKWRAGLLRVKEHRQPRRELNTGAILWQVKYRGAHSEIFRREAKRRSADTRGTRDRHETRGTSKRVSDQKNGTFECMRAKKHFLFFSFSSPTDVFSDRFRRTHL